MPAPMRHSRNSVPAPWSACLMPVMARVCGVLQAAAAF